MKSIIALSSLLTGKDYYSIGRKIADDFFKDMSLDEINLFMQYGYNYK